MSYKSIISPAYETTIEAQEGCVVISQGEESVIVIPAYLRDIFEDRISKAFSDAVDQEILDAS